MANRKALAKSLNAFVEDAKTAITGTKAPSSEADQALASPSTDCTLSPVSPTKGADSPATVIKDQESEPATEKDASQDAELRDSPSKDGNVEPEGELCPEEALTVGGDDDGHNYALIDDKHWLEAQHPPKIDPFLAHVVKRWDGECLLLMSKLLSELAADADPAAGPPRGSQFTNRDMDHTVKQELYARGIGVRDLAEEQWDIERADWTNENDPCQISPGEFQKLHSLVINELVEAISAPLLSEDIPSRGEEAVNLHDCRQGIKTVLIQRAIRALGEEVVCRPAGLEHMGVGKGELWRIFEQIFEGECGRMIEALKVPIPCALTLGKGRVREALLLRLRERCWNLAPYEMHVRWESDSPDIGFYRTYEVVVESLGGMPAPDRSHRETSRVSDASESGRGADVRRPLDLDNSRSWLWEGENGILGRERFSKLLDTLRQERSPSPRSLDERSLSEHDGDLSIQGDGSSDSGSSSDKEDRQEPLNVAGKRFGDDINDFHYAQEALRLRRPGLSSEWRRSNSRYDDYLNDREPSRLRFPGVGSGRRRSSGFLEYERGRLRPLESEDSDDYLFPGPGDSDDYLFPRPADSDHDIPNSRTRFGDYYSIGGYLFNKNDRWTRRGLGIDGLL